MALSSLRSYNSESGNILIYVLGAIVLLGILISVVRGTGSSGNNIQEEELMIRIAEIQEYGHELEKAIAFILRKNYSEADIRFAHPEADAGYGDITDNPDRQVFSIDGGAATYREIPRGIQTATGGDWVFTGANRVHDVGTTDSGTGNDHNAELIAILPNVTEVFCLRMNDTNDVVNPSDSPPQDNGSASFDFYTGLFSQTEDINDTSGDLDGVLEGCFEGGGTPAAGTFHYFRVLLPR
ncbi:MAG: hypothetical protein AAGB32_02535 [Pseudomonadota bacterium]